MANLNDILEGLASLSVSIKKAINDGENLNIPAVSTDLTDAGEDVSETLTGVGLPTLANKTTAVTEKIAPSLASGESQYLPIVTDGLEFFVIASGGTATPLGLKLNSLIAKVNGQ